MSAPVRPGEPRSGLEAILEEESLGKAVDRRLLARLWPYVRPYHAQVTATLLLVLPMFLLELAPAWLVKTGLDRVILADPAAAAGSGALDRLLEPPAGFAPLVWLGLLFLAVVLVHSGLQYAHMVLMATTGQAAMRDLRAAVFRHIESLHMGFFDTYPVGRLVTRATNDVESVAEMFSQGIVALVTDVIKMVGFAAALFLVNAKLALVTFSVVPFLALAALLFRLKVRDAFRTTRVLLARINAWIQESVTGMKVVQLFTREERNLRDFARLNAEHRDAWKQSIRYDAALFSTVELAGGLTVAILLWWGTGAATPGVLYLFIQWMRRFFMPLSDLSAKYSVMQSSMASVERIFQLLDRQPAIRDPAPGRAARPGDGGARGAVEFEDVWFSYQENPRRPEDWVLRGVSFRAAPGDKVAFVGATGAGKTTIIKLLTRLYEVTGGASCSTAWISATCPSRRCGAGWRWCCRTCSCSAARSPRTSPSAARTSRRPRWSGRRGPSRPTSSSSAFPRATPRRSGNAARTSPPASASSSPSRGPSATAPTCWCSTRPPARSTARPKPWSSAASTP